MPIGLIQLRVELRSGPAVRVPSACPAVPLLQPVSMIAVGSARRPS